MFDSQTSTVGSAVPPAHNLIIPQPRSSLPYRRRVHNFVVHQRRSPLPCRRSILLRRPASLHRCRTAAAGGARGLLSVALLRNPQGCHRGLSVSFFLLSGFSECFLSLSCFSSFSSRHLVCVLKNQRIFVNKTAKCEKSLTKLG